MGAIGLPTVVRVDESSQVGELRRRALALASEAGLAEADGARAALVATELGTNLVKHGRGGTAYLQRLAHPGGPVVEVIAADGGPGMRSVQMAMIDGFSTGGTAGTGLGAVRRASDSFDLCAPEGRGTVVVARVGRRPDAARGFPIAGLRIPVAGESACGDQWGATAGANGSFTVLVADGLGHGPHAAAAADEALGVFARVAGRQPGTLVEGLHHALRATRGAAVAVLRCDPGGRLTFAGVGNVSVTAFGTGGARHALLSGQGTAGHRLGRIREQMVDADEGALVVLHTDGVSARWSLDDYGGIGSHDPSVVAATLLRDHARGRDDATVVAVRCP